MTSRDQIKGRMAEILNQPLEALDDEVEMTSLVNSSFILVEMIIELQEEFGVRFDQADMNGISTIGQMVGLFHDRIDK